MAKPWDHKIVQRNTNRFMVFRHVKREMEQTGQCPTAVAVAAALNIDKRLAADHMRALTNADGLPFPIPSGVTRLSDFRHETYPENRRAMLESQLAVDEVMARGVMADEVEEDAGAARRARRRVERMGSAEVYEHDRAGGLR